MQSGKNTEVILIGWLNLLIHLGKSFINSAQNTQK